MIELSEALELVERAQSLEELRAIARSLSAEAIGLGGFFYSNEIDPTTKSGALAQSLAKTLGVPILDDTPRGKFLSSHQFATAFVRLTATMTEADRKSLANESSTRQAETRCGLKRLEPALPQCVETCLR